VSRAVDLGWDTGTLARTLASGGAIVTGVDPDPDMLRVARARDPNGHVDWRLGASDAIESGSAELAVMSRHVAQVFTEDSRPARPWCQVTQSAGASNDRVSPSVADIRYRAGGRER